MSKYFDYFPKIEYNGHIITDITVKSNLVNSAKQDLTLMMPYRVNDGELPEEIAFHYYGTMDYFWIVLMANNITNYYEGWVKDENTFNKYLMRKYKEQSGNKLGYDVIAWTMNQTLLDNILYFFNEKDEIVSVDTAIIDNVPKSYHHLRKTKDGQKFLLDTFINPNKNYRPLRIYEYEYLNNENKRDIYLINKTYVDKVIGDFISSLG